MRQYGVDQYVIDFYCAELKLAIEVDGDDHFVDQEKIKYDKNRQRYIERYGIKFLRYTDDEVYGNINKVVEKIEREVEVLQGGK